MPISSLRRISNSANSSVGASSGRTSDVPFVCVISATVSQRARVRAYSAVSGRPSLSTSSNMSPPERLELCGIATKSAPISAEVFSRYAHISSGLCVSAFAIGTMRRAALAAAFVMITRCRFLPPGADVHSQPNSVVNSPGT